MAEVTIKELTRENIYKVINLKLEEDQVDRVAPNVYSIAESKVRTDFTPRVIYLGDEIIGFVMTDYDPLEREDRKYWIPRFMIDKRFQRKGYGKKAMHEVIRILTEDNECQYIGLSTEPDNEPAIAFYESLGFKKTGEFFEDELILVLSIKEYNASQQI